MKPDLLKILHCPHCSSCLELAPAEASPLEVRRGRLICAGPAEHAFEIVDGIVRFGAALDNEAVQREIAHEKSTYSGSERFQDESLIARLPEAMAELWPHTRYFGCDFQHLIDCIKPSPTDVVLDIGTGPCWSCRLLAERGPRVIALDINDAPYYGLRAADVQFRSYNVYFDRVLESMTNLPFRNGSIDHITFNASFHHTPDHEQTLRECFRVLKPAGKVAMVNEEFVSLLHRFKSGHTVHDDRFHHSIPYRDLEDAAEAAGFSIRYFVADHVRKRLQEVLPLPIARGVTRFFEVLPVSLKQLNSALVILTKPACESDGSHRADPAGSRLFAQERRRL